MSDLVGNPEDRFSRVAAQIVFDHLLLSFNAVKTVLMCTIGIKYQYVSQAVCAYARFSETTKVCAY